MNRLRATQGFTLVELITVVLIIGLAAVMVIPRLMGSTVAASNSDISGQLNSAYQISQEYFSGDWNPNYSTTYDGFDTLAATEIDGSKRIDKRFTWQNSAGQYVSGGVLNTGGAKLVPGAANAKNGMRITIPSASGTQIQLCNANDKVVLCVSDGLYGKQWGASTSTQDAAVAATATGPCNDTPGRAISKALNGSCS